jgi:hypothetical protein
MVGCAPAVILTATSVDPVGQLTPLPFNVRRAGGRIGGRRVMM